MKGINHHIFLAVFLILNLCQVTSFAQPGDGGGDPDVPISGLEWLLLSGGILGVRKMYRNFKK